MNNSKKLQDDAARHRGFPKSPEQAWLEESDYESKTHMVDAIKYSMGFKLAKDLKVSAADNCTHESKRKEGIHKLFWVCNTCKKDLGDV